MTQYLVLTAVGEDRPGLVDEISKFILETGCNIEDSRMAVLGGEFAMLILVGGHAEAVGKVERDAHGIGTRSGLTVQVKPTRQPKAPSEYREHGTMPYEIEAYSMDHPGIVHQVAHFLAGRRVNVRSLETRLSHAPITGLPLFSLHGVIDIPAQENLVDFRRQIQAIGAQENIDIEVKPAHR